MARIDEAEGPGSARFPTYTDGFYARCVASGKRPSHGYPTNHLPEAAIAEMEVESGFAESLKNEK
jgi:hypothetical protein